MGVPFWLGVFILLLLVEAGTMALTTVWFAVGAFGAILVSLIGVPLWVEIAVFLGLSFTVLFFYRPLAVKYVNAKRVRTNVEEMVGKEGKITERVDNLSQSGRMLLKGMDWAARTESDESTIEVGTIVKVLKVEGVKLIVEQVKK